MKYLLSLIALAATFLLFSCSNDAKPKVVNQEQAPVTTVKPASLTEAEVVKFTEKGKSIAKASFMTLAGNMKKAMKAGGPPNAIKFCSMKAMALTDSLSKAHHATIRRTSDKLRNPANQPSALEAKQLEAYANAINNKQPLKPQVSLDKDNKVLFMAPITIAKPVCLKCHGIVGESVAKEHLAIIQKQYPTDKAIGYKEGELRGMWSIKFDR